MNAMIRARVWAGMMLRVAAMMVLAGVVPCRGAGQDSVATAPTLRTNTRLVVVDVVVVDKNHNRVRGLKKEDFALAENGAPQLIRSFDEHVATPVVAASTGPVQPPLPAGTFTNRLAPPQSTAVNVILIDLLNTPLKDQSFLRKQIANYLGTVAPGTDLAVFAMNTRLVMLQGFTADPLLLKHALDGTFASKSAMLPDADEQNSQDFTIVDLLRELGMESDLPGAKQREALMLNQENRLKADAGELRARYTLSNLNSLAAYLAGVPGRKNVIWFSEAFPVHVSAKYPMKYQALFNAGLDPFAGAQNNEMDFRSTANAMTKAQVAVYPVDSRGLLTSSAFSVQTSGVGSSQASFTSENESDFSAALVDTHNTMERLANDTGGRAFINTNDFSGAIKTAVEDGAGYYTLTYSPTNDKWDGERRSIGVRVQQRGLTLTYRHGYYADDPDQKRSALVAQHVEAGGEVQGKLNDASLQRAMVHGAPGATQVLYKVSVLPEAVEMAADKAQTGLPEDRGYRRVGGRFRRFRVDFLLDPGAVTLEQQADGNYTGFVVLATAVYTMDHQVVALAKNQYEVKVSAAQYPVFASRGMPVRQRVNVPVEGRYSIRTGAMDGRTSRVGSIEIPVGMVRQLPVLTDADATSGPGKATLKSRPENK